MFAWAFLSPDLAPQPPEIELPSGSPPDEPNPFRLPDDPSLEKTRPFEVERLPGPTEASEEDETP